MDDGDPMMLGCLGFGFSRSLAIIALFLVFFYAVSSMLGFWGN